MAQASEKSKEKICTLCQEEDKTIVAVTWCINCESFLCTDCYKYHGKIKATKDHHTTSVDSFHELPSFLTNIKSNCPKHNKRFEAYCSIHAEACCIDCIISSHNKCQEIRKIEEVLADFKSSAATYHAESDINDLYQNFDKVTTHLTKLLNAIDRQKEEGLQNIETTKQSIIEHLNKLEENLKDDINTKHSHLQQEIKVSIKQIEEKKRELDQTRIDLNKMKDYATEIQMYEGLKIIEKMTSEKSQYLKKLETEGKLKEKRLNVNLSPLLTKINELVTFGNASVLTTDTYISLDFHKAGQVNVDPSSDKNIKETKPTLLRKIEILKGEEVIVTGCAFMPNGQILFVEQYNKCLLLYSKEGYFERIVTTFPERPCDVTFIKENIVAVTTYSDQRITFVNINENRITTSCQVDCPCYGISCENDVIVVTTAGVGKIIYLDLYCKVTSTQQVNLNSFDICYSENEIYMSDWYDNVSCYKSNGEHLWSHKLEKGNGPRGIAVDKFGVVYVACKNNDKVIAISKDGKNNVTILNEKDGLLEPVDLSCDKKSSTLLVTNCFNGSALLFKI